jgi:6-pyruvoyltetrahydropterin/6-carboxytetrahydropterin synthase
MRNKDNQGMYSVTVRDHIMIAHSLRGEVFGPAQNLHGATYTVDIEFRRAQLDANGIVIDIGLAIDLLHEVLQPLNYQNLDELPAFQGINTTTEVIARYIFDRMRDRLAASPGVTLGPEGLQAMTVTLIESPNAWAAYEGVLEEVAQG